MKFALLACLTLLCSTALAGTPDIAIPDKYISAIKSADLVEVSGTNDLGGTENFIIHNAKAISQFVEFLTSERYNAAPKSLKPEFKSLSSYKVTLSSNGAQVLEFQVIADSVLDLPGDASFYVESDRHSDNIMAPLLRLR